MTLLPSLLLTFLVIALMIATARGLAWFLDHFFPAITVAPYHQALHFRDGELLGVLEAGRHRFRGFRHEFTSFDLRQQQLSIQAQEVNTAEGFSIKATVVGFYRITDPVKVMETSNDHVSTLYTLVQLALRDLISGGEAESLLGGVKHLSPALLDKISDSAAALGVAFSELSIRDLILPGDVKITLSESWRAKKHSLAELEAARGKAAATRTLANAANLYDKNPALLQVRYLEVLETAAAGMGHTFVIGTENAKALTLTK